MEEWEISLMDNKNLNKKILAKEIKSTGTTSVIWGAISLFALGIILGPIAIGYGIKNTDPQEKINANVGIVLGTLGIVVFAVQFYVFILFVMWFRLVFNAGG